MCFFARMHRGLVKHNLELTAKPQPKSKQGDERKHDVRDKYDNNHKINIFLLLLKK